MASNNTAAQFQEPPSAPITTRTNTTGSDISAQFQEPISPHATPAATSENKSTTEKIKDAIKKPFVKEDEVRSPELEAATEVIEAKGLKSP